MSSDADGGFSLDLTAEVIQMRDRLHGLAEKVIRPAGPQWDEREETPWPILEEAAKIGLYSLDFFARQWFEPSGLGTVVAFEELFWATRGLRSRWSATWATGVMQAATARRPTRTVQAPHTPSPRRTSGRSSRVRP